MKQYKIHELLQNTGLSEIGELPQKEFYDDFMWASVVGFADGDITLAHQPYDGAHAELYGEHEYNDGRVAQTMGKVALQNAQNKKTPIYDFQREAAAYAARPDSPVEAHFYTPSQFALTSRSLTFDGNIIVQHEQPFETVIEYGACLTSRSLVRDQITVAREEQKPSFVYMPLMRNHFSNECLIDEYVRSFGPIGARLIIDRAYLPREDGVSSAIDSYMQVCDMFDRQSEMADLILAREMKHLSARDIEVGVRNAPRILVDGGALVMALYDGQPAQGATQPDALHEQLVAAGFKESNIKRTRDVHGGAQIFVAQK